MSHFEEIYEKRRAIDRGTFATVYEGWDKRLERPVAIKELFDQLAADPQVVASFRSEAQKMAEISHPNVLAIHAIHEADGKVWLITELADGGTLRQMARSPNQPEQVIRILRQTLAGLAEIHRRGVVHRNLKPENLFISQGRYKIGDFGVAAGEDAPTMTFTAPRYQAPELLGGKGAVGPPSDLYSLGLIAYELVLGEERFLRVVRDEVRPGDEAGGTEGAHEIWFKLHRGSGELPPLHHVDSSVPEDLSRIVQKMMHKDVDSRYQRAEEVLRDLEDGPDAAGVTRDLVPVRRRRWPWIAVPAAAVLLAVVAILLLRQQKLPIEVTSTPSGASIVYRGEEIGVTPRSMEASEGVVLALRKEGFRETTITIGEGGGTHHEDLEWEPVEVTSEPPGATVRLDGEPVGRTPADLSLRGRDEAEVVVELDGFRPEEFVLRPGHDAHLVLERDGFRSQRAADAASFAAELARWVTAGDTGRLVVQAERASGGVPQVAVGRPLRYRLEAGTPGYGLLFLLTADGSIVRLYPNPRRTAPLELDGRPLILPLREDVMRGFTPEASLPVGRERIYLLRTAAAPPSPPPGRELGGWLVEYPFTPGAADDPARHFARWVVDRLQEEGDGAGLLAADYEVTPAEGPS